MWGAFALEATHENWDELDYYLGWTHIFAADRWYAVDVDLGYTYFDFPKQNHEADTHEVSCFMAPIHFDTGPGRVRPRSLRETYLFLAERIGSGYCSIPFFLAQDKQQVLTFHAKTVANDGAAGLGSLIENDLAGDWENGFTHAVFGVDTTFEWLAFSLTPGIHYQWIWVQHHNFSHPDDINVEDEFWVTVKMSRDIF